MLFGAIILYVTRQPKQRRSITSQKCHDKDQTHLVGIYFSLKSPNFLRRPILIELEALR